MEFIREHKIDRLILGTSGRGRMRKALIGSVAEALIRSVDIPVCTIGPHLKPWPITQDRPHNLIFATSIRHHPDLSFRFAGDLAARLHAELTILHVMKQAHPDLELEARARIKEMLEHAPRLSGQLRVRIRFGNIAGEILSECAALEPEFLVLGVLPASETTTSFREGVAYRLIPTPPALPSPCETFSIEALDGGRGSPAARGGRREALVTCAPGISVTPGKIMPSASPESGDGSGPSIASLHFKPCVP